MGLPVDGGGGGGAAVVVVVDGGDPSERRQASFDRGRLQISPRYHVVVSLPTLVLGMILMFPASYYPYALQAKAYEVEEGQKAMKIQTLLAKGIPTFLDTVGLECP